MLKQFAVTVPEIIDKFSFLFCAMNSFSFLKDNFSWRAFKSFVQAHIALAMLNACVNLKLGRIFILYLSRLIYVILKHYQELIGSS